MWALFKKEIRFFFTSAIGYVVMGLYLLVNSLFLFILKTDYTIFNSGFADLLPFFSLSSWIFVFLIPALTMRIISEEKRTGMLEMLYTKPLSIRDIVLSKYFAILFQIAIILLPTLFFVYILWYFGNPPENLNFASIIGSYIALFLLASAFASIGLWASSLSKNQIIAFVLATFLCFLCFYGLDELIKLLFSDALQSFGLKSHFDDISRGVLDTRNLTYFVSVIVFFVYLTFISLKINKI